MYGFFKLDFKIGGSGVNEGEGFGRTKTTACLRSLQVFVNTRAPDQRQMFVSAHGELVTGFDELTASTNKFINNTQTNDDNSPVKIRYKI